MGELGVRRRPDHPRAIGSFYNHVFGDKGIAYVTELCEHFRDIEHVMPASKGCEDCLAIGATWTELRVCLVCGHVGCCEDSEHAHALQHFNKTGHPVIAPLSRRETWGWCYIHRRYYDPMPASLFRRRSPFAALFGRFGAG